MRRAGEEMRCHHTRAGYYLAHDEKPTAFKGGRPAATKLNPLVALRSVALVSGWRRCVIAFVERLNRDPISGQIACVSSVNAAATRKAGGTSSPSS